MTKLEKIISMAILVTIFCGCVANGSSLTSVAKNEPALKAVGKETVKIQDTDGIKANDNTSTWVATGYYGGGSKVATDPQWDRAAFNSILGYRTGLHVDRVGGVTTLAPSVSPFRNLVVGNDVVDFNLKVSCDVKTGFNSQTCKAMGLGTFNGKPAVFRFLAIQSVDWSLSVAPINSNCQENDVSFCHWVVIYDHEVFLSYSATEPEGKMFVSPKWIVSDGSNTIADRENEERRMRWGQKDATKRCEQFDSSNPRVCVPRDNVTFYEGREKKVWFYASVPFFP